MSIDYQVPVITVTPADPPGPVSPTLPLTLIPLDDLKTLLGISDGTQDDLLTVQGEAVTEILRQYLGRLINAVDMTVTYRGVNAAEIWLPNPPIDTIASVTKDGLALGDPVANLTSGRMFSESQGWLCADEIIVSYSAGFNPIPGTIIDVYGRLVKARVDSGGAAGGGAIGGGTGAMKSLTVFDSHKVDYDVGAAAAISLGGTTGEIEAYAALLLPYIYAHEFIV